VRLVIRTNSFNNVEICTCTCIDVYNFYAFQLLGDEDDTLYEPKILSAISGDSMVNFVPVPHRVDSYPPGKISVSILKTTLSG
jgi:hypothetical protein